MTSELTGFSPIADPGAAVEVEVAMPARAHARYHHEALLDFVVM